MSGGVSLTIDSGLVSDAPQKYSQRMDNGSLKKLFDLIRFLRSEKGCPWDREQTVEDIISDLIEEAYELQWAQARRAPDEVFEETGDVLFVLSFAIALLQEKDPRFTLERIADHAYQKIRRRHPHVFGDESAATPGESLVHWDRVKADEQRDKPAQVRSPSDVPANFSPIRRAEQMQRRAAKAGFDWSDPAGILEKIREEVAEVEARLREPASPKLAEEVGDLFFSVVNLSRFLDIDGEAAFAAANAKFATRYDAMVELIHADGHRLEELTLEEMDRYWEQAKKRE
jgi:tetrapyrrole methylase family protein/MazG family protein